MWKINFPDTPEGEKKLLIYYDQSNSYYIKITRKDDVLFRYVWDGYSEAYNEVLVDYIID